MIKLEHSEGCRNEAQGDHSKKVPKCHPWRSWAAQAESHRKKQVQLESAIQANQEAGLKCHLEWGKAKAACAAKQYEMDLLPKDVAPTRCDKGSADLKKAIEMVSKEKGTS